jgi:hypothetical protein
LSLIFDQLAPAVAGGEEALAKVGLPSGSSDPHRQFLRAGIGLRCIGPVERHSGEINALGIGASQRPGLPAIQRAVQPIPDRACQEAIRIAWIALDDEAGIAPFRVAAEARCEGLCHGQAAVLAEEDAHGLGTPMIAAGDQDAIGIARIDDQAPDAIVAITIRQVAMHHPPMPPAIIGAEVAGDIDIRVQALRIRGEDDILDPSAPADHR